MCCEDQCMNEKGNENDSTELGQCAAGDDIARDAFRQIQTNEEQKAGKQEYE